MTDLLSSRSPEESRRLAAIRPTVVVVTGLSGAGKSQALHALEDLGFFCVDNLPTALAPQAVTLCERGGMARVAFGIDVRVRAFLGEMGNVLALLENEGQRDLHVLFLDASDETLLRRFNETRRPHPLSPPDSVDVARDGATVLDGVRKERERLAPLRARATRVIDTTNLSVHELRRLLVAHFGPASGGAPRMTTRILSFGFKYGAPIDADLVLDVRFLENPYFVPELKPMTGFDEPVRRFVLDSQETKDFIAKTRDLLTYVMPKYEREGKSYLTIAIGCTGGRHRSVAIAEALAPVLADLLGTPIAVAHRDVHRKASTQPKERLANPQADSGLEHAPASERPSVSELKGASSPPPPMTPPLPRARRAPGRGAR
jgi:RNase adapter protein RapZ